MINLVCLIDNNYFQISRLYWIYYWKTRTTDRVIFKTRTGYKIELLHPETIKLLASARKYVNQDKDEENVTK